MQDTAEKIVEMYNKSEIYHGDAEKFIICYENSKRALNEIEGEVEKYENDIELFLFLLYISKKRKLSYDDLL